MGQPLSVQRGEWSRALNATEAAMARIISVKGDSVFVVTHEVSRVLGADHVKELKVMRLNRNLELQDEATIPNSVEGEVLAVSEADGKVAILIQTPLKRGFRLVVYAFEKQSLKRSTHWTLSEMNNVGKKNNFWMWTRQSKNGEYTAWTRVMMDKKVGAAWMDVQLLQQDFSVMDYTMPRIEVESVSDIYVDNHGVVYVVGVNADSKAKKTRINLMRIVKSQVLAWVDSVDVVLSSGKIVNVENDVVLMGGTVWSDKSTKKIQKDNGIYALAYHVAEGKRIGFSYDEFTSEEVNVMVNEDYDEPQAEYAVMNLTISNITTTTHGGVMALQPSIMEKYADSEGNITRSYKRMGYLLVKLDTQGNIVWRVPIRQYVSQNFSELMLDAVVLSEGNNVHLLQSEFYKREDHYVVENKVAMGVPVSTMCNLVDYSINAQGEVTKNLLLKREKIALGGMSNSYKNGKLYLLLTRGNESSLMQINNR